MRSLLKDLFTREEEMEKKRVEMEIKMRENQKALRQLKATTTTTTTTLTRAEYEMAQARMNMLAQMNSAQNIYSYGVLGGSQTATTTTTAQSYNNPWHVLQSTPTQSMLAFDKAISLLELAGYEQRSDPAFHRHLRSMIDDAWQHNTSLALGTAQQIVESVEEYVEAQKEAQLKAAAKLDVITGVEMEHPAMETPLDALVTLWSARFGDSWVDRRSLDDDPFFSLAAKRLLEADLLERHEIYDIDPLQYTHMHTAPRSALNRIVLRIK